MKRKIEEKLLEWKNRKKHKPLIIDGARQVGKTHSILTFGKEHYKNMVYFNFENAKDLSKIFEKNLNPERIIKELSVFSGNTILALKMELKVYHCMQYFVCKKECLKY